MESSFIDIYPFKAHTNRKRPFRGEVMKKAALVLIILCCAFTAFGGFKAKQIKAKKPGQFQCMTTVAGVTYAADLLLNGKDQKKYFYNALTPSNIIAVRLAVFNNGKEEVVLPLNDLRLLSAKGVEFVRIGPEAVAQAVLGEEPVNIDEKPGRTRVGIGGGSLPPYDPNDPRYDPNDPRYDPNDPRNRGQYPPDDYPPGSYPSGGPLGRPGIVLNPGGRGGIDSTENESKLVAVDFRNKAHTSDPIICTLCRDRFLYFSVPEKPATKEGIELILPVSKGIPSEVVLKF
jgi:hypothetical protein